MTTRFQLTEGDLLLFYNSDQSEISTNNCLDSEEVDGSVAYEIGNYNALMKDCPAYQKCKLSLSPLSPLICYEIRFYRW